jgi:hypothetical protein
MPIESLRFEAWLVQASRLEAIWSSDRRALMKDDDVYVKFSEKSTRRPKYRPVALSSPTSSVGSAACKQLHTQKALALVYGNKGGRIG